VTLFPLWNSCAFAAPVSEMTLIVSIEANSALRIFWMVILASQTLQFRVYIGSVLRFKPQGFYSNMFSLS
jgi:hypothetical protein